MHRRQSSASPPRQPLSGTARLVLVALAATTLAACGAPGEGAAEVPIAAVTEAIASCTPAAVESSDPQSCETGWTFTPACRKPAHRTTPDPSCSDEMRECIPDNYGTCTWPAVGAVKEVHFAPVNGTCQRPGNLRNVMNAQFAGTPNLSRYVIALRRGPTDALTVKRLNDTKMARLPTPYPYEYVNLANGTYAGSAVDLATFDGIIVYDLIDIVEPVENQTMCIANMWVAATKRPGAVCPCTRLTSYWATCEVTPSQCAPSGAGNYWGLTSKAQTMGSLGEFASKLSTAKAPACLDCKNIKLDHLNDKLKCLNDSLAYSANLRVGNKTVGYLEKGVAHIGSDYSTTGDLPYAGGCFDRCLSDTSCKTFTFTTNGDGTGATCALKNATPAGSTSPRSVSFSRSPGSVAGNNDGIVYQQLKLTLELKGQEMTEEQIKPIRVLYTSQPSTRHACEAAPTLSNQYTILARDSYDTTSGVSLPYCEALMQEHVNVVFQAHEFRRCSAMIKQLGVHPGASMEALRQLSDFLTGFYLKQLSVMGSASTSPAAGLAFQLVLLQSWHDTITSLALRANRVDQLPDAMRNELAEFWYATSTLNAPTSGILQQLGVSGHPPDQQADLMAEFGEQGARVYEQVMTAALTPLSDTLFDGLAAPDGTPLTGEVLTMVVGDSLADLMDRVGALTVFHDVSCSVTEQCAATPSLSPLAGYFGVVAALASKTDLTDALTRAGAGLGSWRPAFDALVAQHDAWSAALTRLDGTKPVVRVYDLRNLARMRVTSFAANGLFDPAGLNTLKVGMDRADRTRVLDAVRNAHTRLAAGLAKYAEGIEKLIASGTAALQYSNAVERADLVRDRKTTEIDQLEAHKQGLQAAMAAADSEFGSVAAAFENIRQNFDKGRLIQVGNASLPILVPSDGGKYEPGEALDAAGLSFASTPALPLGAVLVVDASGTYSPACAISQVKALNPDGEMEDATASISAAVTGPEGYRLSWTNSGYKAESNTVADNKNRDTTVGGKVEVCATVQYPAQARWYSVSAKTCGYTDIHKTWSHFKGDSSSTGSDKRTQASFASGLRLSNMPFPDAPVGALLLVLVKPGSAEWQVQVLRSGTNSIPIDTKDTIAYFVVNDISGCFGLAASNLQITWRQMQGEDAVAAGLVTAMTNVIRKMRNDAAALAKQGMLLPAQVAEERSEAQRALVTAMPPSATIPDAVHVLFDAFVDREILNLDRMVQIASLDDQIELLKKDVELSDLDRRQGEAAGHMQDLLTNRIVSHMDGELLRDQAEATMEIVRTELLPVLQLWYPTALTQVRDSQNLLALRKVDLGMSTYDLASKLDLALTQLNDDYDIASRREERPSVQSPSIVSVAFPRPAQMTGRPPGDLLGEKPIDVIDPIGVYFPVADAARSFNLWDAIARKGWGTVDIRPQDIFGYGDSRLNCNTNVPVIEHIALFVTRESAQDNAYLNQFQRKFDVHASSNQPFVSSTGVRTYQIEDGVWSRYEIPVFYGAPGDFAGLITSSPRMADQPPIGLSPFGTFDIDFGELSSILQKGGQTGVDSYATSVVVGLALGWRAGERLNWVETCPSH
jgi:hypothetical protein